MKNKNKIIYYTLIVLSIILFIVAVILLNNTKIVAPIIIVISLYLFIGAIIKLCKINNKLKNSVLCTLDLLFWLP